MLHRNSVIPIDMHDKTIRMLFFGNYFGHSDIVIKPTKTGRAEALLEDVMEDAALDPAFQYPVADIFFNDTATTEIYTTDANHTERSVGVKVMLTGDSVYEQLQRCSKLSKAEAEEILQDEQADIPKNLSAICYLSKLCRKTESYANKMALTKLLLGLVDVVNRRLDEESLTPTKIEHDLHNDAISIDTDCVHVIRRNLDTGEVQQKEVTPGDMDVRMPEDYASLYLYTQMDEDGLPISFCMTYCPDPILYGFIKEDLEHAQALYRHAVEKTLDYPKEYLTFTDEELPFLSIIRELQPDSPYIHTPRLHTEYGETYVEFSEEDLKILSLFPDTFNLAINPIEYALDPEQRVHIRIPGKNFTFFSEQMYLSSGAYVYWIEDDYYHIASDIKVLDIRGNYVNANYVDEADNDSFNERIRKLNVYNYEKHLKAYTGTKYHDVAQQVNDALAYCEANTECDLSDIAYTIIDHCMLYENMLRMPSIISAVMRDKTVYGDYVVNFFEEPMRYKYDDFTLVLPPDSNVLYRLERYSYVNGRKVDYFAAKRLEATDFHFYDCDFAVFSAVDVRTGKCSGFLLFDFDYNHEGRTQVTRFLMDAIEVKK